VDPRDDDIQFDFFEDEPATTEVASPRVRLPRRGGQATRPRRPSGPPRGTTPLLRLLGLVGIAIVVLVFFGLLIQSCAATSKHDKYAHYMTAVGTIAHSSVEDGQQMATALTTSGVKPDALAEKLDGIAQQERQNVAAAERLTAPGRLRDENTQLVEALQLRVNGIQGLAETFRATAGSKASSDANLLLQQADRLLASDVVYSDLFVGPAKAVMSQQGVVGVQPPDSKFLANTQLVTANYWGLVLDRLRGSSTSSSGSSNSGSSASGLHGTNVVATKVQPGDKTLSATTLNTVTASTSLEFDVVVHNGGGSQEVQIPVTLTIDKPGHSIVKNQTIQQIDPGQDVTVRFPIPDQVPFARTTHVKVNVAPVPHESDATNNSATYPVIFSFG
jgi:hypothetical protein